MPAINRPKVEVTIGAVDKLSGNIKGIQKRLGVFGQQHQRVMRNASRASSKLTASVKNIAKAYLGIQGVRILGRGIGKVITLNRDFEKTLDSVSAKFGGLAAVGTDGMHRLEGVAKEVGRTTEFTAQQAAEGLEFLAMAGFSADKSIASLPAVVNLATAANVDLARATDIATDTLGAFGLVTDDAIKQGQHLARVNDVMAATVTSANTDMEGLFESFTKVGSTATSYGYSIETVAALTGVLANSGIKASEAGTALKRVMVNLAGGSSAATTSLKALGVTAFDDAGNFRDVVDVIGDLQTSTKDLTDAQKAKHLANIFGVRALAAGNILMQEGAEGLRQYRAELEGSTGAADDMAAVMRDNLDGSIRGLQSRLQSVALGGGGAFTQVLKDNIDNIIKWMDEMGGAEKLTQGLAAALRGVVGTVTTVGKALFVAYKVVKPMAPALLVLVASIKAYKIAVAAAAVAQAILNGAMFANPVGLIVAGIVALIGVVTLLVKHWDKVKDAGTAAWDAIRASFYTVADYITTVWGAVISTLIKGARVVAKSLGFDTTPFDNALQKIEDFREGIRDKSFFGGTSLTGDTPQTPRAIGNAYVANLERKREQAAQVEIQVNNNADANIRARVSGTEVPVRVNTGAQGAYGTGAW